MTRRFFPSSILPWCKNAENSVCFWRYVSFGMMVCAAIFMGFEQVAYASRAIFIENGRHTEPAHLTHHIDTRRINALSQSWKAWRLPGSLVHQSPVTRLPVLANGQSALPSNADNFHGAWNASVNPRTGKSSFGMSLASMLYGFGKEKRDLTISYGSTASSSGPDPFDLGPQWSWNVGTEHPSSSEVSGHRTTDITTSEGHSFTMEESRNQRGENVWHPLRHKIGDVVVSGEPGNWTIAMATGIREHFRNGFEDWEEKRDGHRIWFYYDRNGDGDPQRHLVYICDHILTPIQVEGLGNACKEGVKLTYGSDSVTIHGLQTITLYKKRMAGSQSVDRIVLPSLSSPDTTGQTTESTIQFFYDSAGNRPWLLAKVLSPTGAYTSFLYNNEADRANARIQGLPTGINNTFLPVVTEQITHENNSAMPDKRLWYYYGRAGEAPGQAHNYTGYQGDNTVEPGKDNLFDCPDSYTYSVTTDNGLTNTTTTYNKYHLPVQVVQKSDKTFAITGQNSFTYPQWKNTTFASLPSNYSLPLRTDSKLFAVDEPNNQALNFQVTKEKRYNDNGQLLWQKDAFGREVYIQYCPVSGDTHCPVSDAAWPQMTKPEKILYMPVNHESLQSSNQALPVAREIVFDYAGLPVASPETDGAASPGEGVKPWHLWRVQDKKFAVVPLANVLAIKPGDSLPEPDGNSVSQDIRYQYGNKAGAQDYGTLVQVAITKYPEKVPSSLRGSYFRTLSGYKVSSGAGKTVIFNIDTHIDPALKTRSVSTGVSYASPTPSSENTTLVSVPGDDRIRSSITTYSLDSGAEMNSYDPLKSMGVKWSYDKWNRPVKKTVTPLSGGEPQVTTWKYAMKSGEIDVIQTGPFGNQGKVVMTDDHHILSTWHRFKKQEEYDSNDKDGWIPDTTIRYAKTGKPASKTVWIASDSVNGKPGKAIALTTTYGYDTLNRKVWERQPDGKINIMVRDDPAMRVVTYQVAADNKGSGHLAPLLHVVQSNILGKPDSDFVFSLDPDAKKHGKPLYGSQLKTLLVNLKQSLASPATLTTLNSQGLLPLSGGNSLLYFIRRAIAGGAWLTRTITTYDSFGRKTKQVQGNGATIGWSWKNGNLIATKTPDGRVIHDTFNVEGKKVARCVKPAGSDECHVLGSRGYDSSGNLMWQSDEMGHVIKYVYDASGRKTGMITPPTKEAPKGHVFAWHYSSLGVTEEDIDGKPYAKYTYDPKSWNLVDMEDQVSHLHYDYDPDNGRVVKITRSAPVTFKPLPGMHYPGGTIEYQWDRYNKLAKYKDSTGIWHLTVHDPLGRVSRTLVVLPGQKKATLLTAISYDDFGRVLAIVNGIGVKRTFVYDSFGHLFSTVDAKGNSVLQKLQYTYDPDTANILSFTRVEGDQSATQNYTYDKTNNLVSMTCSATGKSGMPSPLCPRETALRGSQFTTPPIILSQQYAFDHWNNIRTVNEKLSDQEKGGSHTGTKTMTYIYAGESGGSTESKMFNPHKMTGFTVHWSGERLDASPHTLTYDTMGRIIRDADGNTLHYNAFGQQDRFTNAQTGVSTHYSYDSVGHQVAEQSFDANGKKLEAPLYMIYSGNRIIAQVQMDAQGKTHESTELDSVAHAEDGVVTRWYLHDYKGDVLCVLDNDSQKTMDNVYSPYGMQYNLLQNEKSAAASRVLASLLSWQHHLPGFDNQMSDPFTGYQFLGGGYRAYNPVYRHFMSMDSYSPFRQIDGYGFAGNNPVMNTDPTGHMPKWMNYVMAGVGIAMTISLGILMPLAAAGAAAVTTMATAASVSTDIVGALALAGSIVSGVVSLASGSLQVASTACSKNKKLAIANSAFGIASGIFSIGLAGGSIFSGAMALKATRSLYLMTTALVIGSGISGVLAGGLSTATSAMSEAAISNSSIAGRHGYMKALNIMNYVSIGLMVATTGLVAIFGTNLVGQYIDSKLMPKSQEFAEYVKKLTSDDYSDTSSEASEYENDGVLEDDDEKIRGSEAKDLEGKYDQAETVVKKAVNLQSVNILEDDGVTLSKIRSYSLRRTNTNSPQLKFKFISRSAFNRIVKDLFNGRLRARDLDGAIQSEVMTKTTTNFRNRTPSTYESM